MSFPRASRTVCPDISVSFEFFPPASEAMEATLWESIKRLAPLGPSFVSVTYGAGGSTRERTHATVARIVNETLVKPAAHLTCVAAAREEIDAIVRDYWDIGVRHIVALRGDPQGGPGTKFCPHPEGYADSATLVAGIRRVADFEISVSTYPEGHPESVSADADIDVLKAKIDAGASRAITQFFFENEIYLRFLEKVRGAGHRYSDHSRHRPRAKFQADGEFRQAGRSRDPAMACRSFRRSRRRSANAKTRRRDGRRRTGSRSRRSRRQGFSFLHDEPRRPCLCDLPSFGAPAETRTRGRLMTRGLTGDETRAAFQSAARERILVLDGAMGTMIQQHKFGETEFRGARFADWPRDLRGNNDLLSLTQPRAIKAIHLAYLEAGADIIETNTFNSTRISQADYGMEELVAELNFAAARLAREAADEAQGKDGKRRFVAGALGPTNRTASISPDVNNPGFRAVSFDDLREAYAEAAAALIEGGADILIVETIFDTLNAKAALSAIDGVFEARGERLPVMISGTITDLSGRTLSGQTPAAFWYALRHAKPLTIGLNCALGAREMRAHLAELSRIADTLICAYPNAGLPNEFGLYDESPEYMASLIGEFAEAGLINIVGGCCGTTPAHIQAIAARVKGLAPRKVPKIEPLLRLSGLEPFVLGPRDSFRQYRRAHQCHRLRQIPQIDQGRRFLRRARCRARSSGDGRADHRRQHGRGPARFRKGDGRVFEPHRRRARHFACAGDDQFIEIRGHRSRPQMRARQSQSSIPYR